ncbi:MAG: SGNH/GDSL hydrolase family protein [Acidimicrobiia bacterium]
MKRLAAALCLLLVLGGCGIGYAVPQHHNAQGAPTKRVLFFGDSIMKSTAPVIAARMQAKGMRAVVKYGAANAGTPVQATWVGTSHSPLRELQSLLDSFDPDIVIANFAGHEFRSWKAWDASIDAMSQAIRASGATVYWTIPPFIGNTYIDGDAWKPAVYYFAGLPSSDPQAAGHMIDWNRAMRPANDQVWLNGRPLQAKFAYDLWAPEDRTGHRVWLRDEIHPSPEGKDRIARWTTYAIRSEWGMP